MCIIAIKPKGVKMFDETTIKTMFINNPDGAGIMYYDNHNVVIEKGFMTCKSLLKKLHSRDFTNTNLVIHFRIGTSGLNDALNCHPYPINQKNSLKCLAKLAMAHNGILRGYIPPKTAPINDTQFFINNVLNELSPNFYHNKDVLFMIKELIGTNKLAFLDNKNRLTLVGDFIEDGDYIYSNTSYKLSTLYPKAPKTTNTNVCPKAKTSPGKFSLGSTNVRLNPHNPYLNDTNDCFWTDDEPNDFWTDYDKRHPLRY